MEKSLHMFRKKVWWYGSVSAGDNDMGLRKSQETSILRIAKSQSGGLELRNFGTHVRKYTWPDMVQGIVPEDSCLCVPHMHPA